MIREIQTFLHICDGGAFAAAAEQLGITQSAVSAQIKNLEKHLGFALFDRNRRGAVLSEQGERIVPMARQMVALFAQMSAAQTHSGSLKIGILPALQSAILPELLARLPETPQLHTAPHADLLNGLQNRQWDVAIVVRPSTPLPTHFVAHTLCHDPCFLLSKTDIQPHHHQNILFNLPFLAYDEQAFGNTALTQFCQQRGFNAPILRSDDATALISLIKNNIGISILPQSCLKHADVSGLTRLPIAVSRELVAVALHDHAEHAQMLAQAWQNPPPSASAWHGLAAEKPANLGLDNAFLTAHFRA